jgi:hypothetical protein
MVGETRHPLLLFLNLFYPHWFGGKHSVVARQEKKSIQSKSCVYWGYCVETGRLKSLSKILYSNQADCSPNLACMIALHEESVANHRFLKGVLWPLTASSAL